MSQRGINSGNEQATCAITRLNQTLLQSKIGGKCAKTYTNVYMQTY